jgi:aminoglycoside 6'-N-acetyltransferase
MIKGPRIQLRPIHGEDWPLIEKWGKDREILWGTYQRFQLDHIPLLRQAFQQTALLTREAGFLLIETVNDPRVIGFVRYTLMKFPDADFPHPEIGFGITDVTARKQGFAKEAVGMLISYLFDGYSSERISSLTDAENVAAQRLLESLHFQREGLLRRASFRDAEWRDMLIYGLLRAEWKQGRTQMLK